MPMTCVNHPSMMAGIVRCRRCQRTFCRNCVVALRGQYYCAECKGQQVRDIQSGTEAGVLELAGIGRRFAAVWLDSMLATLVLVIPVMIVVAMDVASAAGNPEQAQTRMGGFIVFAAIGVVVLMLVYEGLMLSSRGQTLGKMAVGIKVVTPEGHDITGGQAWGRAALRQVFFSYFALINYLPAFFTKQKTAIHDLACKTRVVRSRR
jgi:uncharacterized RDD family membrane protein YckC